MDHVHIAFHALTIGHSWSRELALQYGQQWLDVCMGFAR